MTAYFLVYGWILLTSSMLYIKKMEYPKAKKWFCFLSFFAVFLIFALRHPVMGADLQYGNPSGYLAKYVWLADANWEEIRTDPATGYYEIGYILLNKFLVLFSEHYRLLLAACAALSLAPVGYTVYKESKMPELSLCIFMGLPAFTLLFSGLRQGIAIGVCVLALHWVIRKKPLRFLLTVALAMTFHKSAALFFVAYPVYHFKMNRYLRWGTFALPVAVYLLRHPLFALAGRLYEAYAVPDYNNSYRFFMLLCLIYLFCCAFSRESKETSGLKNLFLIAVCIQALAGMHSIVMRMGHYFMMPLILLLPAVLSSMQHKKLAVFFQIAIGICFIAFGLYMLRTDIWACSYPYYPFWES